MKNVRVNVKRFMAGCAAGFMLLTAGASMPVKASAEDEEILFEVTVDNYEDVNVGGEVVFEDVQPSEPSNVVEELPVEAPAPVVEEPAPAPAEPAPAPAEPAPAPAEPAPAPADQAPAAEPAQPPADSTFYSFQDFNPETDYVAEIPETVRTEPERKKPTPEPTPEVTPEPTPVVTPEPTPVVTPEPTPVVTPEPTPVVTPEPTPVVTPEVTPDPSKKPPQEPIEVAETGILDDYGKYMVVGGVLAAILAALSHIGVSLKTAGGDWMEVKGAKRTLLSKNKEEEKELTK